VNLADELLEHLLGDGEVGNDAVLHRADDRDRAGGLAKHFLGAVTDGLNGLFGIRAAFHADGDN